MILAVPILFLAVAALGAQSPAGEGVVRAAHAKYAGKWPTTYTYVQKTILPDGRPETWYQAFKLPNQLRIDVAPSITGRAMLYRSDSLYSYGAKKMKTRAYWPNSFLLLLGDIHVSPPELTIKRLRAFGFDLNTTHEDTWQGKRVVVVGAKKGDLRSKQFWMEKDRMILVRLIEPNALDRSKPLIADIGKYTKLGGGWIEGEVKITLGGTPTQFQEVHDPRLESSLNPMIFDPGPYTLPEWVGPMPDIWGKPRRVG